MGKEQPATCVIADESELLDLDVGTDLGGHARIEDTLSIVDDDATKRGKRTRLGVGFTERKRTRPPTSLPIGSTVLERYVVEAEIGAGAMGTVYRAHHTKLERSVALKVMHEHLMHETSLVQRFQREATIAAKLSHPNVAAVLDVGETPDRKQVMVLELVEGKSLGTIMDAEMLDPKRIARIVAHLLRGLDHAHGLGLVHRDLKPDNIIVEAPGTPDEIARIVDFGIATLLKSDDTLEKLTGTGMIVGTPLYMAPEQARAEQVDHRADLYALGIMLYEMLSGTSPFDGTAMEVAVAKMDKDPPPIAQRAPEVKVDRVLTAFLDKLIARMPDDRFATAHAALAVIEAYRRDPDQAATMLGVIDIERALRIVSLP
jgi:eukaryotic-like serine/threonine-protein kinase